MIQLCMREDISWGQFSFRIAFKNISIYIFNDIWPGSSQYTGNSQSPYCLWGAGATKYTQRNM